MPPACSFTRRCFFSSYRKGVTDPDPRDARIAELEAQLAAAQEQIAQLQQQVADLVRRREQQMRQALQGAVALALHDSRLHHRSVLTGSCGMAAGRGGRW